MTTLKNCDIISGNPNIEKIAETRTPIINESRNTVHENAEIRGLSL